MQSIYYCDKCKGIIISRKRSVQYNYTVSGTTTETLLEVMGGYKFEKESHKVQMNIHYDPTDTSMKMLKLSAYKCNSLQHYRTCNSTKIQEIKVYDGFLEKLLQVKTDIYFNMIFDSCINEIDEYIFKNYITCDSNKYRTFYKWKHTYDFLSTMIRDDIIAEESLPFVATILLQLQSMDFMSN